MGIYSSLEDKWYDFVDWVDQYIPIAGIVDKVDKIFPSFVLILVIIFLLLLVIFFSFSGASQSAQLVVLNKVSVPVEGAEIKVMGNCGSELVLVTDSLGKAFFSACSPALSVFVQKEGYLDYNEDIALENGKAQIILNPKQAVRLSQNLHVEIIDEDDFIISGARLELICSNGSRTQLGSQVQTGFSFEVPLACTSAQLKATATGYQEQTVNVTNAEERKIITLKKEETKATLIIETNDSVDGPIPAEIVITEKTSGKAETYFTDNGGAKTIEIKSGEYSYIASTNRGQAKQGEFTLSPKQVRTLEIMFEHVSQQVVEDSNVITIIVSTDNNNPIQSASVVIYRDGNNAGTLTTNSEGKTQQKTILASQMNAKYFAVVSAVDFETKTVQVYPKNKTAEPTRIVLRKGGAQLKVKLIDDLNAPVRNAVVSLNLQPVAIQTGFATTDINGSVKFTNLQSGSYKIKASTEKEEAELTVNLSTDEVKEVTMRLVLGEGVIKYKFIDNKSVAQNPAFVLYEKVGNETQKVIEGVAKNGYFETAKLKVGTKLKLVVPDGNYFETETLVYEITRTRQDKTIVLRKKDDVPNDNKVQMFLNSIYESNPLYGSPQTSSRVMPGRKYYFEFSVLLNEAQESENTLISNFFVSPKDVNVLLENNKLKINSAYSIDGYSSLLTAQKRSVIIDAVSQTLVDSSAKQANISLLSKAPKMIPVVLEIETDINAAGDVGVYFESIYGLEKSLLYSREMIIGETFCFASSNSACPELLFTNYIKWIDVKSSARAFVPLGEDPFVVFADDNYILRTSVRNLTDTLVGDVNLTLTIPKESIDNIAFTGDKNRVSTKVNLAPLANSVFVENKFDAKKQGGSEKISESIERLSGGLNELRDVQGNNYVVRFIAKSKNQLEIDVMPVSIDEGANYPLFLVKTKYRGQRPVSAHWYAEKIDVQGSSLFRIAQGTTDANGIEITSFNALNLSTGDRVRFTAYDDNGALDGNKIITVSKQITLAQPQRHECLSVIIDSTDVSATTNFFKRVNKNDGVPIRFDSNCDEDRIVGTHTDLLMSEIQFVVPARGTKTVTLTAKQRGEIFGAYPVQLVTINGGTYQQLAYFDIDVRGAQCFDIDQAIFDLRTTGTISSKVINTCFSGRNDNYYPKMNVSTNSVSLSYKKPGIPEKVTGTIQIMHIGIEGLVQGFSWGQEIYQERGNNCGVPDYLVTPYRPEFIYIEEGMNNCELTAKKYTEFVPEQKVEPDINETDPSIPFYQLPQLSRDRIISQLISPEGTWVSTNQPSASNDTNTATLSSAGKTKNNVLYFSPDSKDSAAQPWGTTLDTGVAAGNSERIKTGDVYRMRINTSEYVPTQPCEVQHMLEWVAFDRPPGWDFSGERWQGGGEVNFEALIIDWQGASNGGACVQQKLTQYNLLDEISVMPVSLVTQGSKTSCGFSSFWQCRKVVCKVKAHSEFHRTLGALQEQVAREDINFEFAPAEGSVLPIGSYGYPLVPKWTELDEAHGIPVGEKVIDEKKQLTTNCVTPLGFVPMEIAPGEKGNYAMPDPANPLIEYTSDRTFAAIVKSTIPDGFRAFLKNGTIYMEYLGNVKWEALDPEDPDSYRMIHTTSDVAGPNIDFNISKVNLLGSEYAIISVQDWVSGTEKKEQLFQVKLVGSPTSCYSNEGIEGMTGQQFVPRLLFNWDWNGITENQCDSKNSNYAYCDAAQFNISLFKRLAAIEDYLKRGNNTEVINKSAFYAYLLKDNYNTQFLKDFEEYYSQAFANAPAFFNTNPQSAGFDKFITENKLSFNESTTNTTTLPYAGLYRVEIDLPRDDKSIMSLFNGTATNASVNITLRPVYKAPNYNPFYEMPFDGEVGKKEAGNVRAEYGASLSSGQVRLNPTTKALTYANALSNFSVQTSQNLSELQNAQILSLTKTGLMKLTPTQPTPVFMSITGSPGNLQAKYSYLGSLVATMGAKEWKMATSTLSLNGKCADFEKDNELLFTDITMGGQTRGLTWNSVKSGTIGLLTTYYTPKAVESTIRVTPVDENVVKFNSLPNLKNSSTIMLNNFDAQGLEAYDSINEIFKMVADEKVCMTKNAENEVKFWWNPAYITQLEKQVVSSTGSSCTRTRR